MSREAVIVTAVRTPIGRIGGKLSALQAGDLGAIVVREAIRRSNVCPEEIDDVIFGNLYNTEMTNAGRYIALASGLPMSIPGVTLDRGCASSLNAAAYATAMIESGHANIMIAGGAESDSNRNWIMRKPKKWYQTAPPQMMLSGISAPGELGVTMGTTAENVGKKYGITREACDAFAVESHRKAVIAQREGRFDGQIVPVKVEKQSTAVQDECVRENIKNG